MDAYLLQSYGPDGLVLTDTPEPETGAGRVKVRVEHIAVNPLDWKIRNGYLAEMLPLPLPVVIGTDIAGVVTEVGPDVDSIEVGDRVAGYADSGAFAGIAVTRAARITRVPDGLDLALAAALVTAGETAQRVIGLLDPAPGSTVVVNGAAGSVGSLVTQLLVPDHRVIGTASAANHDYLRSLGATPVSYGESMLAELREAAPDGVDAAVDTAGRDFVARVAPLVPADRVVTTVDFAAAAQGAIVADGDPSQLTASTLGGVLDRAARGELTVEIDHTYAFDELAEALARSEAGHLRGKLLVTGPSVG